VAEGAALEMPCGRKFTAGSNPALSALKSVNSQGVFPVGGYDRARGGEPTLANFLQHCYLHKSVIG
jgi:hypothetical protein